MPAAPPTVEAKKPAPPPPAASTTAKGADTAARPPAPAPSPAPAAKAAAPAPANGQRNFDRMAVRAKLAVSEPGDAVEREADAIADRVMRAPGPGAAPASASAIPQPASAAPASTLQRAVDDREGGAHEPESGDGSVPSDARDLVARLGPGEPLAPEVRAFFEPRLGRPLDDVRVHLDQAAADAARTLQARAFAWGNHVAFASGEYQPGTESGRHLLAHELAHVLQNDTMALGGVVHRKPSPRWKDPSDIGADAFDPGKDKRARTALETLRLPAIKSRHYDAYLALANAKQLKRPKGYDRKKEKFATDQRPNWREKVDPSKFHKAVGWDDDARRQRLDFYGTKHAKTISGTNGEVDELLQIPQWTPDGTWRSMQVDHVVEAQLGGSDAFPNYELLTGAHNTNVGSLLRATIYANVKAYLEATDKNTGDTIVKQYLAENDVAFKRVTLGGEGKNTEDTSQFWSSKQVLAGAHLVWLKDVDRPKKDDGNDKTRFALFSGTGQGFIDAFPLRGNMVAVSNRGRLGGIALTKITLDKDFAKAKADAAIGRLEGQWVIPRGTSAKSKADTKFATTLNAIAGKRYAGSLESPKPPEMDLHGASPLSFGAVEFGRGRLFADGTLTPSHPLLAGLKIPVAWRGGDFSLEYVVQADELAGKLPLPGVSIDEAALSLGYGPQGLTARGDLGFSVKGFGAGRLSVGVGGAGLEAQGRFIADRRLFDDATLEVGYDTRQGFHGSGRLAINDPKKIKGIKKAHLKASWKKSAFEATGEVEPDVPGLKKAALGVSYADDTLVIKGELDIDDKVPGVESATVGVSVTQGPGGWKVGASGVVRPRLPGLKGDATLAFAYDDGLVTIQGEFSVDRELAPGERLHGKVMAGVTNANVDKDGKRAAGGEGDKFSVFGRARIGGSFYKDKLKGTLDLALQPDGSVRVGGELEVGAFEVFPQYPSEDDSHHKRHFGTPPVPVPGLGFSVGSVSIGLAVYAGVTLDAWASVGPGTFTGLTLTVEPFDPEKDGLDGLKLHGHAGFEVGGSAGFGLDASVGLKLSAAIVELNGELHAKVSVGIPEGTPLLKAYTDIAYSHDEGVTVDGGLDLHIQPMLELALAGEVHVDLNVLIGTITLWSKDWDIGSVDFPLPVGIDAQSKFHYNSRQGLGSMPSAKDAVKVSEPKVDSDTMRDAASGKHGDHETRDEDGRKLSEDELWRLSSGEGAGSEAAPLDPSEYHGHSDKVVAQNPNWLADDHADSQLRGGDEDDGIGHDTAGDAAARGAELDMKRDPASSRAAPRSVDENVVDRLGPGRPLDTATRGFFEQRLGTDLSRVRVHAGAGADREARRLGARAFAVGEHIAFAAGEHSPSTPEGRELLAHELAHVMQHQDGAARQVARTPDAAPPAASSAAAPPAGAAPATPGAAAPVGAGRGPITLPVLHLPVMKYSAAPENAHRRAAYDQALADGVERPAGYRRADLDSRQRTIWTGATPAAALRAALAAKVPGLDPAKVYIATPRTLGLTGAGAQMLIGTPNEIALALRQPRWDRQGHPDPNPFEIDHIVELQIGGARYDRLDNLELLERNANGASGRAIDGFMDQAFAAYARSPDAQALPAADRNADTLRRAYRVRFASFAPQGAPAVGKRWTRPEVLAGDPMEGLHLYDPSTAALPAAAGAAPAAHGAILQPWPHGVDPARYTGSPAMLVLYASPRGGAPHAVPLHDGQPANAHQALQGWLPGLDVSQLALTLGGSADGPIGHIRGRLVHAQLAAGAKTDVDIAIKRRRGLANAGVLDTESLLAQLTERLREGGVTALSPVLVEEVDVLPGIGLVVAGRVQPTISMLRNATLDFQVRGADLQVSKTFSGGEIALGGPFRVDTSDLTVALGTHSGVHVAGGLDFSIARLGQGTLRGDGRREGFTVNGRFDFDRTLFDGDAHIELGYRRGPDAPDGKLSGAGALTIGPGKVRGIRQAHVQAAFDGEQRSIEGSAELDLPGVESASLGVQFTPEGGTVISGNARFRDRPGLRNGQIAATLAEGPDGWSLSAHGGAEADFAGFTARLEASYAHGLFLFSADAPFSVGEHVHGRVHVGVTNGQVDDQGRLVDGSAPAAGAGTGELRPFGNGDVRVRPLDWLEGAVNLRVRPDGGVRIGGAIGIAHPLTVFDQYPSPEHATRTLFEMPHLSVPLVGISVAGHTVGIALSVDGGVTGHAFVGPGMLTRAELRIDDFDPADPASLRIGGNAAFELPAEAGVDAHLDVGLSLGLAIVDATAGINVSASASVHAQVSPQVEIDWSAAAGLHLHADLDTSLSPKLAFDVNGFAKVTLDALVHTFTLWRKDWNLAHKELGSGLTLGLHAPVDYYSDGRGVVFDSNAVHFDVPSLNLDTLHELMHDNGDEEKDDD
jgi:hypothetical protein